MKALGTTGRIIFALAFAGFGTIHLIMGANFGGLVPAWIPGGAFWVYLTGIAYWAACISIIIEKQTALACALLGAVVIFIAITVHLTAAINATETKAALPELINFIKALAIGGAAWYIAGIYSARRTATV